MFTYMKKILRLVCVLFFLTGCVTSPESGRRALILTDEGYENALGLQAFQEVLKKERLSTDPKWNAMLARVGQRIAAAAKKPDYKWEFKLVESKEKNAFCLPGGKIAVYTGMMSVFENEAQMAAVIGHEVAHATERHGGQRMTLALGTQAALATAGAVIGGENSTKRSLILGALGVGATVGAVLPFSRDNESVADEVGLKYMARAGYDPNEAAKFWERFAKVGGGGGPSFLATHPSSEDRKENLRKRVPGVMPEYQASPKHGVGEKI